MTLYHFTSKQHLRYIKKMGLSRGDVPLNPYTIGEHAVWLTTDLQSKRQKWAEHGVFDKTECRIKVDIPVSDSRLIKWSVYAKQKNVSDKWYRALDVTGGGGSDNWYLFFGVIKPELFKAVQELKQEINEEETLCLQI